ncbi:hypothetical protein BH11PSE14_BH11PSE14_08480 [soil metagenome]
MSPELLAIAVALLGMAATAAWFGVSRRRKEEAELGVQALATMKWRDCIALVLESLHREGYPRATDTVEEAGATDFMLQHGGERVLLSYKHGTAYRLSEANLREFASAVSMRGAARGLLITLGMAEPSAVALAGSSRVEIIGGSALWPRLRGLVSPQILESVRSVAAGRTRKGLWVGGAGSLLAGLAIMVGSRLLDASPANAQSNSAPPAAAVGSVPRPDAAAESSASDAAVIRQLEATAKAMDAVARLSPDALAVRRADVVKRIGHLSQVSSASWSAQRTVLILLNRTDGKDKLLVDEACRVITQNEEMRFTRIQLQPPDGSTQAVRWRLCE